MHNTRDKRIAELEELLVETERQLVTLHRGEDRADYPPPPPPPPPPAPPIPPAANIPPPQNPPPASSPGANVSFPSAEVLLRYGGISMVVASAIFFVSTAISRGWVGPTAQLVLATIASLAMIGQSFRFSSERRPWRVSMAIGGAGALFASGVVGFVGLDLLSFEVAVAWLVGSVGVFLGLSRLHDAQSLAIASVPAVLVGVVLLRFGSWYDAGLLCALGAAYLVGMTATTHGRSWFVARAIGSFFGALVAGAGVVGSIADNADGSTLILLTGISIVAVLIAAASQALDFGAIDRGESPIAEAVVEARVAALTIPWISAMVAFVVEDLDLVSFDLFWTGFIVAGVLGAAVAVLPAMPQTMRLLHGAAAIATMATAITAVVEGPVLLVVLLGQALLAGFLAYRFKTPDMIIVAALLAVFVTCLTGIGLIEGTFVEGLTIAESAALLAVVVASGLVGWVLQQDGHVKQGWVLTWLLSLGWASAAFRDVPQGQMIVTLLWAAIGTALVVIGSRITDREAVHAGFVTLAVTSGKLIFVDLVAVDVLWRAGLFFVVGALFLRLAFMLPKLTGVEKAEANAISDDGIAG